MSDTNNPGTHLKELGKSDYELAAGHSDIRGWTVKNDNKQILGNVNDLILDTKEKKIKYLILDLDGNELYLQGRKVLIPLNITEIDEVHKNVIASGITANELSSLPSYEKGKITSNLEDIIRTVFAVRSRTQHSDNKVPDKQSSYQTVTGDSSSTENKTHHSTENRKQSVIGLFAYTSEAQSAVAYLKENGFNSSDIEISYRERGDFENRESRDSITGFFSKLFNKDESGWLQSEDAKFYSMVVVNGLNLAEAERAAEILDRHGAINIEDKVKAYQERNQTDSGNNPVRTYHSRIISRKDDDTRWWS